MRPTQLGFRNPKERTPDAMPVSLTNRGDSLNFRPESLNRKGTNLPQSKRFPDRGLGEQTAGAVTTVFTGPGCYNDIENYKKLTKRPCSSLMKKPSAIPETESGKPCYIMIGDALKYEPAFHSTFKKVKEVNDFNIPRECPISIHQPFRMKSVEAFKKQMTDRNISNVQRSVDEFTVSLNHNLSQKRGITPIGKSTLMSSTSPFGLTQSTATKSRKTAISGGKSVSIKNLGAINSSKVTSFLTSKQLDDSSTFDRSNTDGYVRIRHSQTPQLKDDRFLAKSVSLSDTERIKLKSVLPKNANNYYSLRKGLYLQSSQCKSSLQGLLSDSACMDYSAIVKEAMRTQKKKTKKKQIQNWDTSNGYSQDDQIIQILDQSKMRLKAEGRKHSQRMRRLDYDAINEYVNEIMKVQ